MTAPMPPSPGVGRVPQFGLADRLRRARLDAGLEQTQLAELLATSRTTIVKYEAGQFPGERLRAHLTRKVLQWATVTGVDFEWLMTGTASLEAQRAHAPNVTIGTDSATVQVIARSERTRTRRGRGPRNRVA